jgi:hypothetical protein
MLATHDQHLQSITKGYVYYSISVFVIHFVDNNFYYNLQNKLQSFDHLCQTNKHTLLNIPQQETLKFLRST